MTGSVGPLEWSLLGVASMLALLIALVLGGNFHSPDWLPAPEPRAAAGAAGPVQQPPKASLDSLSNTWEAPLFNPDRKPDPAVRQTDTQAINLSDLNLTGVIIDGSTRLALIKQSGGKDLKVRQGDRLPNSWTLQQLDPTQATFSLDGRFQVLRLQAPRLPLPSTTPPITLTIDPAQ